MGVPVPPATITDDITTPARRWARRDGICIVARCTTTARSGCAGVSSRVLRTRDRCAPLPSLTLACETYCKLQVQERCIWRITLRPLRLYLVPLQACTPGSTGMYSQNDAVILKTLLALPAMSFTKSPRMDFLYRKERSGRHNCTRLWCGVCTLPHGFGTYCMLQKTGTMHMVYCVRPLPVVHQLHYDTRLQAASNTPHYYSIKARYSVSVFDPTI